MLISKTQPQTAINSEQSISPKSNPTEDKSFQKLADNLKKNDAFDKQAGDANQTRRDPILIDRAIPLTPESPIIPYNGDPIIDYAPPGFGQNDDVVSTGGNPKPDDITVAPGKRPIFGTQGDDVIAGSNSDDIVLARGGDDLVRGGKGDDNINGGAGDDKLRGGRGNDTLEGGLGNDKLHGGRGDDRLIAGAGDNVLRGGRGNDTAVLDGFVAEYKITEKEVNGKTVISLTHNRTGDTTTLRNIEKVEFRGYGAAVGGRVPEPTTLDINKLRDLIPNELNN